jgi:hypothetical protein
VENGLIKAFFSLLFCISVVSAEMHSSKYIQILDTHKLKQSEVSALAYKNNKLYALSNNAELYVYSLNIHNFKIINLQLIEKKILRNKKNHKLQDKKEDSEGLCFKNNDLLVSFERENRIELYDIDARKKKNVKIDPLLRDKKSYREANQGLESVAYNKKYGVITAPELPLKNQSLSTIYSKKKSWSFREKGHITAIEFMSENRVLVLLRDKALVSVNLSKCINGLCKSKKLMRVKGSFEGLTKIKDNIYMMVNDNDGSYFQKTHLVLFEVRD